MPFSTDLHGVSGVNVLLDRVGSSWLDVGHLQDVRIIGPSCNNNVGDFRMKPSFDISFHLNPPGSDVMYEAGLFQSKLFIIGVQRGKGCVKVGIGSAVLEGLALWPQPRSFEGG